MMRLILFVIVALNVTEVMGQISGEPRTKRRWKKEEANHNCIETTKYTAEERRRFYPFDTSVVVKVVSFDNLENSGFEHTLPMKNEEVDFSRITEEKTLNGDQIDKLTNILYNVTYKGKIFVLSGAGCYNPRNAILFYDSSNHLLEFIELCFECHERRLSSEKISLGDLCNQKLGLLKEFFLTAGIEIGTVKAVR
jgi:hypothetical protein